MDKELLLGWGLFALVVITLGFLLGPLIAFIIAIIAIIPGRIFID